MKDVTVPIMFPVMDDDGNVNDIKKLNMAGGSCIIMRPCKELTNYWEMNAPEILKNIFVWSNN